MSRISFPKPNLNTLKNRTQKPVRKISSFVKRRPLTAFLILIAALFITIVINGILSRPAKIDNTPENKTKAVNTFNINSTPTISLPAKVEKSGIIKITALTGGVVNKTNVSQGQTVKAGTTILSLSTNYTGSSIQSIQTQIAQKNYQNSLDSYEDQKKLIEKQREVAVLSDENSDKPRDISDKSLTDTRNLITLNEDILASINTNLEALENTNTGGANDSLILSTKQLKGQYESGLIQLKSGLDNTDYQQSDENPPAKLSDLSREISLLQLSTQQKALDLGLKISKLQYKLAQVTESLNHPAAPIGGVIEKLYVHPGQVVSPGDTLALLNGSGKGISASVLVSPEVSKLVSQLQHSHIFIKDTRLDVLPTYISTEATDGGLYSVYFDIPIEYANDLTDNQEITVEIPLGADNSQTVYPFIPIDAIYQTQTANYIFVNENNYAVSKEVSLGQIFGSYAEVLNELPANTQIILDRNILAGDEVVEKN